MPTPRSKNAVKVPIATPRRCSGTRSTTISASEGKSSENAAPMSTAPAIATARDSPSMIAVSPSASIIPAPITHGIGP